MGSLLVLRPGAIGDTLLTMPALAALRARFSEAPIHLVGNVAAGELVVRAGLADRLTAFDASEVTALFMPSGPTEGLGPIRAGVAWCADPDGVLRASFARLGAREVVVAPSRPPDAWRHVADYLVDTLAPLGVAPVGEPEVRLDLEMPPMAASLAAERLRHLGLVDHRWIAVHLGSGSPAKNWPATALAALLARVPAALGMTPVVVVGPADRDTLAALLAAVPAPPALLRDLPLLPLAAALGGAAAYVGNDSGPTHLAALLGLPTLALFGPSEPALWAPRGRRVRVLRHEPLADLAPEAVLAALRDLLA